jgi:hypothetical protein
MRFMIDDFQGDFGLENLVCPVTRIMEVLRHGMGQWHLSTGAQHPLQAQREKHGLDAGGFPGRVRCDEDV